MGIRALLKKIQIDSKHKIVSVIGAQWGDEGKGKIVDSLAKSFDIVARFNGGSNAGHTIKFKDKKFAFHLLPSGMLYDNVTNVIGNGVVLDIESLENELDSLQRDNINNENNLLISNRSHLVINAHKAIDAKNESLMGKSKIGTTNKGIGPCYSHKTARFGIRAGDLAYDFDLFREKYLQLLHYAGTKYGEQNEIELERLFQFRKRFKSNILDASYFLAESLRQGKRILAEGANATMLDLDFGTYPYVTSSNTTNTNIFNGLGITPQKIFSIGIAKAYTTRVGEGPFPTELSDATGDSLCREGNEFGTTTGRKRRVGWLDIPIIAYAARLNGFDVLNMTKLDVLSQLEKIKIATRYSWNKTSMKPGEFPSTLEELGKAELEYETLSGWNCDISNVRTYEELPMNARAYIERVEQLVGVPIRCIGVGEQRDAFVIK